MSKIKNMADLISVLSDVLEKTIEGTIDTDRARVALTASSRIIEAAHADTRMKTAALAHNVKVVESGGFELLDIRKTEQIIHKETDK